MLKIISRCPGFSWAPPKFVFKSFRGVRGFPGTPRNDNDDCDLDQEEDREEEEGEDEWSSGDEEEEEEEHEFRSVEAYQSGSSGQGRVSPVCGIGGIVLDSVSPFGGSVQCTSYALFCLRLVKPSVVVQLWLSYGLGACRRTFERGTSNS